MKRQIFEKNLILDSVRNNDKYNREEIKVVKVELDRLLYQYYKCFKCS
ncbi:MAG: hypothetical protein N3I35_19650 [Clostridia bacterium]|nr:hypothetical protein [Clostridia bacterium]